MHRGNWPQAIMGIMGAVEGFFRLWEKTRATYGEGTPQTGEQFDHSATLRELATQLESTDPGDQWTGTAADEDEDVWNANYDAILSYLRSVDGVFDLSNHYWQSYSSAIMNATPPQEPEQ